jgi:hypothetical protein
VERRYTADTGSTVRKHVSALCGSCVSICLCTCGYSLIQATSSESTCALCIYSCVCVCMLMCVCLCLSISPDTRSIVKKHISISLYACMAFVCLFVSACVCLATPRIHAHLVKKHVGALCVSVCFMYVYLLNYSSDTISLVWKQESAWMYVEIHTWTRVLHTCIYTQSMHESSVLRLHTQITSTATHTYINTCTHT